MLQLGHTLLMTFDDDDDTIRMHDDNDTLYTKLIYGTEYFNLGEEICIGASIDI